MIVIAIAGKEISSLEAFQNWLNEDLREEFLLPPPREGKIIADCFFLSINESGKKITKVAGIRYTPWEEFLNPMDPQDFKDVEAAFEWLGAKENEKPPISSRHQV